MKTYMRSVLFRLFIYIATFPVVALAAPATNTVEMRQYNGTGWVPLQLAPLSAAGGLVMSASGVPSFSSTPTNASYNVNGTAGAGFIDLVFQSSDPSAPAGSHGRIFLDSVGSLAFLPAASNFNGSFIFANTADRAYTFPNATGTVITNNTPSFNAQISNSVNGAASTPALILTGTVFTGGSATTTKPQLLVEPATATSTGWNTLGTLVGANAAGGFTGNLIDLQVNGSSILSVTAGAIMNLGSSVIRDVSGTLALQGARLNIANTGYVAQTPSTNTATSGTVVPFSIAPVYNQSSGTAANTDLLINRTETAVGSGAQRLIQAQVASVDKFYVSNTGAIFSASTININSSYITDVAGGTLKIKSGANACAGTFTLVAGAATVTNTSVTANSVIIFSLKTAGGAITAAPYLTAQTPSTSFAVAAGGGDTSTYNYIILEVN